MAVLGILFAILGLGFLIFIHELGHYWMAKKMGMQIETFSIGFGPSLVSWKNRSGESWQIGSLPFGGYVRIKGMEKSKENPYKIQGGYYSKAPWQRALVAFAGPLANILCAALCFLGVYLAGGKQTHFHYLTPTIGSVDPHSQLYAFGVRPGDQINSYNGEMFQNAQDHLIQPLLSPEEAVITGVHTKSNTPFQYTITPYPRQTSKGTLPTFGVEGPAQFLYYHATPTSPLIDSPIAQSGLEDLDLIVWADGYPVYSSQHLSQLINENQALLLIQRGDQTFLRRVPRLKLQDLRLSSFLKEEMRDWQYEAHLEKHKFPFLTFIPYNITQDNVIESTYQLVDPEDTKHVFPTHILGPLEQPLQQGDVILAVDGVPVSYAHETLEQLQHKKLSLIVYRNSPPLPEQLTLDQAQELFDQTHHPKNFAPILASFGSKQPTRQHDHFVLLNPITPRSRLELPMTAEQKQQLLTHFQEQEQQIAQMQDPDLKQQQIAQLKELKQQRFIGLQHISDLRVEHNPGPLPLLQNAVHEITTTLHALTTGNVHPKHLSGPVGIVQIMSSNSQQGLPHSLFWLGLISLNLAILNLLPLPILDGGYIMLALFETITKKPVPIQTLEKVLIPFAFLFFGALIYFTLNDLIRIFIGNF